MRSTSRHDGAADIASPGSLPHSGVNVNETERAISAAAGAAFVLAGLKRGSLTGAILALTGGALLYRGISGRCQLYEALGISTTGCPVSSAICKVSEAIAREARAAVEDDTVAQASYDSFPASDPPSYSGNV